MLADVGIVIPPSAITEPHDEVGVLVVDLGRVHRLQENLPILRVPRLKVVEELLLESGPEISKNDFDLNDERAITPAEIKVVREGDACRVREQHTPKRLRQWIARRAARQRERHGHLAGWSHPAVPGSSGCPIAVCA